MWTAGTHPPQWIQVDLLKDSRIMGVDLLVDQYPAGRTVHQIWARGSDPSDSLVLLSEFDGPTESGQLLTYTAPPGLLPYRYIRIFSTVSPSWVAWSEIVIHTQNVTGISEDSPGIPRSNSLLQNYPNPFNPGTTIGYGISSGESGWVRLAVFDLLGREVALLVNENQAPGRYEVRFDAAGLSSGVYLYKLTAGNFVRTRRMAVIK